jgi:excisionase family DNA binding protein
MRCKSEDGQSWTTVRVQALRDRLGIAAFDPSQADGETISVDETAHRLKISVGSVQRLIRQGILPATQLMPSAPWKVPVAALDTEAVQIGVQGVIARRPRNFVDLKDKRL